MSNETASGSETSSQYLPRPASKIRWRPALLIIGAALAGVLWIQFREVAHQQGRNLQTICIGLASILLLLIWCLCFSRLRWMIRLIVLAGFVVTLGAAALSLNIRGVTGDLLIIADSRHGFRGYPPVSFKMNAAELSTLVGAKAQLSLVEIKKTAAQLAKQQGRPVFITLSERGIVGASPSGDAEHVPALPVRGEIDIVGAGDAVTANLTAALAAGATLREALEIASAAASIVIHQLGTTGTASVEQIQRLLTK